MFVLLCIIVAAMAAVEEGKTFRLHRLLFSRDYKSRSDGAKDRMHALRFRCARIVALCLINSALGRQGGPNNAEQLFAHKTSADL